MSSAQQLFVKAKEFTPSSVTYDEPQTNKRGGKSVNLRLNGQPIVLQVPLMLTWGVNEWVDEQGARWVRTGESLGQGDSTEEESDVFSESVLENQGFPFLPDPTSSNPKQSACLTQDTKSPSNTMIFIFIV